MAIKRLKMSKRRKAMKKIDLKEISPIVELLGEERVDKLKDGICEAILEQVKWDLEHWGEYLVYPPDFEHIFGEAYESIEKKLKKIYTDKALEVAQKAVEQMSKGAVKNESSND